MSASIEHQLLCRIIQDQDFHTVEKLRIDESYFISDTNSQTREVFRLIRDNYHNEVTYGQVPSWQLIQTRFYGFPWSPSGDTIQSLCLQLRYHKLRAQVLTLADDLARRAQVDPVSAMDTIKEAAATLTSEHEISSDLLLSNSYEKLFEDYELTANGQGITGIPWPWDALNEDTQGMHPGNFIVLYGRPKMGKTWIALYVGTKAYMSNQRVLVYSLEMHEKDILRRIASIIAGVDYKRFKSGRLDPESARKVWDILLFLRDEEKGRTAQGHSPALLAVHPRSASSGVSTLQAKIREFKPDIVIVDGMYLMRDDRTKSRSMEWKSVAHISQDLKQTAGIFNIPIIGVTQANRHAEKDPAKADLMELAYADALAQDCDLCMRVHRQKDKNTQEWEAVLSLPGSREGTLDGFAINYSPSTDFNFKRIAMSQDPSAGPQAQGNAPPTSGSNPRAGGKNPPPITPPVNYRNKS